MLFFYAICLTSISNVSSCFCKDFHKKKKKILWQKLRAKKIRTSGLALSNDTFYSYRTGWLIQISQSKTSPYLTVLSLRRKTCHLNKVTIPFARYSRIVLIKMDLRADVSKYRPEVYKSEKSKILKKIHKVALRKLFT